MDSRFKRFCWAASQRTAYFLIFPKHKNHSFIFLSILQLSFFYYFFNNQNWSFLKSSFWYVNFLYAIMCQWWIKWMIRFKKENKFYLTYKTAMNNSVPLCIVYIQVIMTAGCYGVQKSNNAEYIYVHISFILIICIRQFHFWFNRQKMCTRILIKFEIFKSKYFFFIDYFIYTKCHLPCYNKYIMMQSCNIKRNNFNIQKILPQVMLRHKTGFHFLSSYFYFSLKHAYAWTG